ncbi:hypothetical protein DMB92_09195, partial [Campylobacter sp. MIT 99-7217]
FIDNAGGFYNLAKDSELKALNLQSLINDSLVSAIKSKGTRTSDFYALLKDLEHFNKLSEAGKKDTLELDKEIIDNFLARALGASFARFSRLENPSSNLYEFLKGAKDYLVEKNTANLFSETSKAVSDINNYDFIKYA